MKACREEPQREAHGYLSLGGGKWIVENIGAYDTRVWEMTPAGPKLRARIETGETRFLQGDRVAVQEDDALSFVDLATGKLRVLEKTWLFGATADFFFVTGADGDRKTGRRLRAADLSPAGTVAWGNVTDAMRGLDDIHVLDGGNSLAIGETLVSFVTGKILQQHLLFGAPSPDGKHISACDSASRSIVEVSAETGMFGARFPLQKDKGVNDCSTSDSSAYAGDHTIFWFEQGMDTKDAGRRMIVAAGDTRTGKVTRFDEPSQTWSIGFSSYPFFEGGKLCTTIASFHTSWRSCDWALSGGRIVRSPEKPRSPSAPPLGMKGRVEPTCEECYRVGRFVVPGEGKIQDPLTGNVYDLTPGEVEWAAVPRVENRCRRESLSVSP